MDERLPTEVRETGHKLSVQGFLLGKLVSGVHGGLKISSKANFCGQKIVLLVVLTNSIKKQSDLFCFWTGDERNKLSYHILIRSQDATVNVSSSISKGMVTQRISAEVWSKSYACAQLNYPWSGSHGQLFHTIWTGIARRKGLRKIHRPCTLEANSKVALNLSPNAVVAATRDRVWRDDITDHFKHDDAL